MANELQISFQAGKTVYFQVRNAVGQVASGTGFINYATTGVAQYAITGTEQGTASAYYAGNMPVVAAGIYNVLAKQQLGGSVAETDPTIGSETLNWDGTLVMPRSALTTSGQLGNFLPVRLARGVQHLNFPIYFKSSADHITPFTSGTVSGQISRDGGSFGVLQSGAFTEVGLGHYNLQALTSGDLAANTARLHFTAVGISGGASDPVPMVFILQRVSGQAVT